jgi:hypothetical protein
MGEDHLQVQKGHKSMSINTILDRHSDCSQGRQHLRLDSIAISQLRAPADTRNIAYMMTLLINASVRVHPPWHFLRPMAMETVKRVSTMIIE